MLGKVGDAALNLAQSLAGVVDKAGFLDEIVHAQRAREPRSAAGGQGVVRPGKVIAQRLGHILAEEDAARVLHRVENRKRVIHADFQMLRRDDVDGLNRLVHIIGHDDFAVGVHAGAGNGGAWQLRNLHLQLGLHGLGQLPAVGDQHRAGQLVMLGLAQQVGGYPCGVAAAVCQHQNLGRAGNHINANLAENLALCRCNVDISGADNLVHGGHALGAVGKGGHGLCAAGFENQVNARNDSRGQNGGVHLAIAARGGGHNNLLDARDLGGNHVHQHGGGVGRRAAGHINARPLDGGVLLPQHNAGLVIDNKILMELLLMEVADVLGGHLQRGDELRVGLVQLGKGFINLRLADADIGQIGMVKLGRVVNQCGVAAGADVRNDGVDGGLHIGLGADVAVQDFLGAYLIKVIQTNHFARASFILLSSSVSWAYLNL